MTLQRNLHQSENSLAPPTLYTLKLLFVYIYILENRVFFLRQSYLAFCLYYFIVLNILNRFYFYIFSLSFSNFVMCFCYLFSFIFISVLI